jgi:hypothetical protein
MIVAMATVVAHLLAPSGAIPNHPRWPLLIIRRRWPNPTPEDFEALFTRNGWPAAWRNGVFPFHHYHSNAHEGSGRLRGEVTVQFGGEGGVEVAARPGDVIVLPPAPDTRKSLRAAHSASSAPIPTARIRTPACRRSRAGEERAKHNSGRLAARRSGASGPAGRSSSTGNDAYTRFVTGRLMDARVEKRTKPAILGAGKHRYRVVENWAKLPEGWEFKDVAAVAVDSKDRVYCFNRGEHPMIVFDREGNFIRSWGEGTFPRAHGLHIDANDILYCTDDGGTSCASARPRGRCCSSSAVPGQADPIHERQAVSPLHAHGALAARRHLCERRVRQRTGAQVSPDGKLLKSWGEPGTDAGQFNVVHNVVTDAEGWVYVADRENHRVQVFDGNGRYETQWANLHRPCALYCCRGRRPQFAIGELGPSMPVNRSTRTSARGSRSSTKGQARRAPWRRRRAWTRAGQFIAPHGLAIDSAATSTWESELHRVPRLFPEQKIAWRMRSLQKLEKLS